MRNRGFYIFILSMMIVTLGCSGKETKSQDVADETVNTAATEETGATGTTVETEKQIEKYNDSGFVTGDYVRSLKHKGEFTAAPKEISLDYLIGRWSVEVISEDLSYLYFVFDDDGVFYLFSPFGGYMGDFSNYTLEGNTVTLNFSETMDSSWKELIFNNEEKLVLNYDYDFKDFYDVGVLKNDRVILRSGIEKRKAGEKCLLKGTEVIKTEQHSVVAVDNLRLRKEPSVYGRIGNFWYRYYLDMKLRDLLEDSDYKVIDEEGYLTLKDESTLLLKGMVTTYDAKTADESTIDGITAPWYRIALNDLDGESITQYWWVFGGYLEDYDEGRNSEYTKTLFNTALEKGFIVIDEEK